MRIFYHSLLAFIFLNIGIFSAQTASGADIRVYDGQGRLSSIVIEGSIEKGDVARFLEAVVTTGVDTYSIVLQSGGGDALEAMRLGRLVRALGLKVEAPLRQRQGNACFPRPTQTSNCRCDSACVLIYIGGLDRYGDALGVHRIYIDQKIQNRLTLNQSALLSKEIQSEVNKYFHEMSAPTSLLELANRSASDEIKLLDSQYIEDNLYGLPGDVQEWLLARCGSTKKLFEQLSKAAGGKEEKRHQEDYIRALKCSNYHLRAERLRNFKHVITSALESIDQNTIQSRPTLSKAKANSRLTLQDAIRMPKNNFVELLAIYGFGITDIDALSDSGSYRLGRRTVSADLSNSGNVLSIQISTEVDPEYEQQPFTAPIADGISPVSKPADFISKFGLPWRESVQGTDVGLLYFETQNADIRATFSLPAVNLRTVRLDPPGYWRSRLGK